MLRIGFIVGVLAFVSIALVRAQDESAIEQPQKRFRELEEARGVREPDIKHLIGGRCTRCHLGIDNPAYRATTARRRDGKLDYSFADPAIQKRFEDAWPQADDRRPRIKMFMAHPRLHLFAGGKSPHPAATFDCLDCHGADDRRAELDDDGHKRWTSSIVQYHAAVEGAIQEKTVPMIETKLAQASCQACHGREAVLLDGAEKYANGARVAQSEACYACHRMDDHDVLAEDESKRARRPGPPLTHIADKLDKKWTYNFVLDPESFRLGTRMPRFFARKSDPQARQASRILDDKEIAAAAIVEYVFQCGDSRRYPPVGIGGGAVGPVLEDLGRDARVERGMAIVHQVGCIACHRLDEAYGRELAGGGIHRYLAEFGPNLSGLGDKLGTPKGRRWLREWLKDPAHYSADTAMPAMGLSDDEIRAVVDYLASLHINQMDRANLSRNPALGGVSAWTSAEPALCIDGGAVTFRKGSEADVDRLLDRFGGKAAGLAPRDKVLKLGETMVEHFGCFSCHEMRDPDPARANRWRAHEPIGVPWTWKIFPEKGEFKRMPFPAVSTEEEKDALITYVMGDAMESWARTKRPMAVCSPERHDLTRGLRVLNEHNCGGCHELRSERLLVEGAGGPRWCEGKVKVTEPDGRMYVHWLADPATLALNDVQRALERGVPASRVVELRPRTGAVAVDGRGGLKWQKSDFLGITYEQPAQLECRMPPSLRAEGSRVQADWLRAYLKEPYQIRPLLRTRKAPTRAGETVDEFNVRMPMFSLRKHEIEALVAYFKVGGSPAPDAAPPDVEARRAELAPAFETLRSTCTKCHLPGADGWAPDLRRMGTRLRPTWIASYVRDPLLHETCTLMPGFSPKDEAELKALVDALRAYEGLEKRPGK